MRVTKYTTLLNEDHTCSLVKEKSTNYECKCEQFSNPEVIVKCLNTVFQLNRRTEEYVYMLCFATNMRLIGVFEISHGTVDASFCNTREIFQKALLCNTANIVIAHNHPSGNAVPSVDDRNTSRKLKEAGSLMAIEMVDFLIVADETFYSFKQNNEF